MNTLLLDQTTWDLCLSGGNIAVASDPYSVAQSVASACRTFLGEVYYDTTIGVPYFQNILGAICSISYIKAQLCSAAATVPGCNNPVCYITGINNRVMSAQIQFTDSNQSTQAVLVTAFVPVTNYVIGTTGDVIGSFGPLVGP